MSDLSYIIEGLRPLAVPIDSLTLDPDNARKHNRRNLDAIKTSFERYGQVKPIAVRKSDLVVLAGNGRLDVARELGWTHIAAVLMTGTEEELAAFAILDNKTAELAEWDDAALAEILSDIATNDTDLVQGLGFTQGELDNYVDIEEVISDGQIIPESEPIQGSEDQETTTKKGKKPKKSGLSGGVSGGTVAGPSSDRTEAQEGKGPTERDSTVFTEKQHAVFADVAREVRKEKGNQDLSVGECLRIIAKRYLKSRDD